MKSYNAGETSIATTEKMWATPLIRAMLYPEFGFTTFESDGKEGAGIYAENPENGEKTLVINMEDLVVFSNKYIAMDDILQPDSQKLKYFDSEGNLLDLDDIIAHSKQLNAGKDDAESRILADLAYGDVELGQIEFEVQNQEKLVFYITKEDGAKAIISECKFCEDYNLDNLKRDTDEIINYISPKRTHKYCEKDHQLQDEDADQHSYSSVIEIQYDSLLENPGGDFTSESTLFA